MKRNVFLWPAVVLAMTLSAQAQTKFAIINIQGAIISTKDGQKAAAELQAKTQPKKRELEQKQNNITQLQDQLNKGQNTLSDSAKNDLYKQIEDKKKNLQRDIEDAQSDLQSEQQRLLSKIGQKMLAVVEKYAKDNGYSAVLDVSNPNTPVIYASPAIDITKEIIELYDKSAAQLESPSSTTKAAPGTPTHRPTSAKPAAK